ncbi:hypothetical protein HYALB_00000214 [Hymenoscyphus albidus]|uniref:Uncharacterized protein n=1 Tax=Hymenoscyphus albidus TaxID=595503 RepID=A0A9N9LPQ4_9HELO|nr:hypothetical protein HYALB_00000214 [Hymenoscyphus albidus]
MQFSIPTIIVALLATSIAATSTDRRATMIVGKILLRPMRWRLQGPGTCTKPNTNFDTTAQYCSWQCGPDAKC